MPEAEGRRYAPRLMDLDSLIELLVIEHGAIREGLNKAREAATRDDFVGVKAELERIDPVFRQHIADEESTVLGVLIRQFGTRGAAEEIRIFQQHRPIYQLMKRLLDLASLSTEELRSKGEELRELFENHAKMEEAGAFPRAASVGK